MILSPQQDIAVKKIKDWLQDYPERDFVLSGYAGTGKTTIARYLEDILGYRIVYATLSGKAANVLRDKGVKQVGTIHSWLYKCEGRDSKTNELLFELDPSYELTGAQLVIVDEYSMVPQSLIDDLKSCVHKILWLGDPFQLPPVKETQDITPDYALTEIHRQAKDSPILTAATDVRQGTPLDMGGKGGFRYDYKHKMAMGDFIGADQVLVGRHATRKKWNRIFLKHYGFDTTKMKQVPIGGEKIICLRNNKEKGLFNGMIGECISGKWDGSKYYISFQCNGTVYSGLEIHVPSFSFNPKEYSTMPFNHKICVFDYGYTITTHKSQGSEWDSVLIYNEPIGKTGEDRRKWLYTAITRAKERCILVEPS